MSETNQDDDSFRPWHISGFDQCGSEKYKKRHNIIGDSDNFKILYEQEHRGESDEFRRIYVQDQELAKSRQEDSDDEFRPFKTGITRFDERMSKKSGEVEAGDSSKISGNGSVERNLTEHNQDDTSERWEDEHLNADSGSALSSGGESSVSSASISSAKMEKPFEDGYGAGFEQGKANGYEEGLSRGMEDGLTRGMEEGYRSGEEKGEQEGYDAGFLQGEEDGRVVNDAKALEIISSIEDILHKVEQSWHNTVKNHESRILSLICKIAEKVVFARVELDEGIVKESILNALATMPEPEEITLNICPDDYEYIEMVKDDFFERVKSLKSVAVVSNPSVTRGGCKIESSKAKVETDIQSRLDQIFSAVMGARLS